MPSKKGRLPIEFGKISNIPLDEINHIKLAASAAAVSLRNNDNISYKTIIETANKSLSKHKLGMFSGFLIAAVGNHG